MNIAVKFNNPTYLTEAKNPWISFRKFAIVASNDFDSHSIWMDLPDERAADIVSAPTLSSTTFASVLTLLAVRAIS